MKIKVDSDHVHDVLAALASTFVQPLRDLSRSITSSKDELIIINDNLNKIYTSIVGEFVDAGQIEKSTIICELQSYNWQKMDEYDKVTLLNSVIAELERRYKAGEFDIFCEICNYPFNYLWLDYKTQFNKKLQKKLKEKVYQLAKLHNLRTWQDYTVDDIRPSVTITLENLDEQKFRVLEFIEKEALELFYEDSMERQKTLIEMLSRHIARYELLADCI